MRWFVSDKLADAAILLVRLAHWVDSSFLSYHHVSGASVSYEEKEG